MAYDQFGIEFVLTYTANSEHETDTGMLIMFLFAFLTVQTPTWALQKSTQRLQINNMLHVSNVMNSKTRPEHCPLQV